MTDMGAIVLAVLFWMAFQFSVLQLMIQIR
jgi:hypothetical protein